MKKTLLASLVTILLCSNTAAAFSDLPESHNYYFPISYLEYEGLINGYSDGTVRPENLINRAELVKILVEGLNQSSNNFGETYANTYNNCFPDVKTEWFAPYVCYALEEGWINGYPDGFFRPERNINKVEAAKIIINAFGIPTSTVENKPYIDTPKTEWYTPFLEVAVEKNLLEEAAGIYFNPDDLRSRGEVSVMIARIMQIQYMNDPVYTNAIRAEFKTFMLLNKLRSEEGGINTKLKLNSNLTKVARAHSKDMLETIGGLSHEGSDGSQSSDRIRNSGISGNIGTGENVGTGIYSSSRSIYQAILDVHNNIFMIEPDGECNHRTTILGTCMPFTEVGIGVYAKDNRMYFTEDFVFFVQ